MPVLLTLAAFASAAAAQPAPFVIDDEIAAEPAPLLTATDGLVEEWPDKAEMDELAERDALEEAYEDAVEMARSARPD